MTTTFSAPAECSTQFVIPGYSIGVGENKLMYAYDPGYHVKDQKNPVRCSPEEVESWWGQDIGNESAATSTALGGTTMICPAQFTTARVENQTSSTLIACCPS